MTANDKRVLDLLPAELKGMAEKIMDKFDRTQRLRESRIGIQNGVLLGEEVVPCHLFLASLYEMSHQGCHRVGLDHVNGTQVSTVFIGVAVDGMWFESLVTTREDETSIRKYRTLAEARAGHAELVANSGTYPNGDPIVPPEPPLGSEMMGL